MNMDHGSKKSSAPLQPRKQFAIDMIAHHKEGIRMSKELLKMYSSGPMVDVAKNIVASQTEQIATMQAYLDSLKK